MPAVTWWRIVAPHFVAGLRVEDGVVREAAPIIWWSRGRKWSEVRAYFKSKGYSGNKF